MKFARTSDPKTLVMRFRVTESDRALIEERALAANLSASEFVLKAALSRQTISKADSLLINQVRELADQLADFYMSGTPRQDERLRPLLDACLKTMCAISSRPRTKRK